jgi:hypothetical protein
MKVDNPHLYDKITDEAMLTIGPFFLILFPVKVPDRGGNNMLLGRSFAIGLTMKNSNKNHENG